MPRIPLGAPLLLPTTRGPRTVHAGVLDEDAEFAYRNGQCFALAAALHDEHGWGLVAHLSRPGDILWEQATHGADAAQVLADPLWFYDLVHVLVEHPCGDLVDIHGAHDPVGYHEAAVDAHGTAALVAVPLAALEEGFATYGVAQHAGCAAMFAAAVTEDLTGSLVW